MVVNARDLPAARLRRWSAHLVLGLLALAAIGWSWSRLSELRELEGNLARARGSIPALESAADEVAKQCGLPPFSDPESLRSFPVEIGRFPSRREMECANRVTKARSDLIEVYLEIDRLGPRIEEARDGLSPLLPMTALLVVAFAVWIWLGEIRHRRPRAR